MELNWGEFVCLKKKYYTEKKSFDTEQFLNGKNMKLIKTFWNLKKYAKLKKCSKLLFET